MTVTVDDAFVETLFELIEQISNDVDHPYHPPVIGVLVSGTWRLSLHAIADFDLIARSERAIYVPC
jgi:hypothetical protein